MPDYRDVDPRELRVPPSRPQGADPAKLQRQIARLVGKLRRACAAYSKIGDVLP